MPWNCMFYLDGCYLAPMTRSDESALGVLERKTLREVYGPLQVKNSKYSNRWNDELYEFEK